MYKLYHFFMLLVGAGLAALSIHNIIKEHGALSWEYLWAAIGLVVAISSRIKLGENEKEG